MRVAICMSGQLRTWEKCNVNVLKLVDRLNHQVNFFCHTWNFDSIPTPIIASTGKEDTVLHSEETIAKMLDTYKPISYCVEDQQKNKKVLEDAVEKGLLIQNKKPPAVWTSPQFYGVMAASNLKREYELKHNFKYNACIRLRYDQYIPESQIDYIIDILNQIESNTIYTMHNRENNRYPKMIYGDVFWISDSPTYDKVAMFYKAIPSIDANLFIQATPPEGVLTHYINSLDIKNFRTYLDIKICLFQKHVDEKLRLGLDGAGPHEIIYENIIN